MSLNISHSAKKAGIKMADYPTTALGEPTKRRETRISNNLEIDSETKRQLTNDTEKRSQPITAAVALQDVRLTQKHDKTPTIKISQYKLPQKICEIEQTNSSTKLSEADQQKLVKDKMKQKANKLRLECHQKLIDNKINSRRNSSVKLIQSISPKNEENSSWRSQDGKFVLSPAMRRSEQTARSAASDASKKLDESQVELKYKSANSSTLIEESKGISKIQLNFGKKNFIEHYLTLKMEVERKTIELQLQEIDKKKGCFDRLKDCLRLSVRSNYLVRVQLLALLKRQIQVKEDTCLLEYIWKELKQQKFQKYGEHWIHLGFTEKDPIVDFKSTGTFALLGMYLFSKRHKKYFRQNYIKCRYFYVRSFIKTTEIFARLLKYNKLPALNSKEFVDWFCAICFFVFEELAKIELSIEVTDHIFTKILKRIDKQLSKILKIYKLATIP